MNDSEDRCIKNMMKLPPPGPSHQTPPLDSPVDTVRDVFKNILTVLGEERIYPAGYNPIPKPPEWVQVHCPQCAKFICKATPGSRVHVLCNRCKTESVTEIAA